MRLSFHTATSSPEAIAKAAYRLAPKAVVELVGTGDTFDVELSPKHPEDVTELVSELIELVNDYYLREIISRKTEAVRTLFLAQAFSSVLTPLGHESKPD